MQKDPLLVISYHIEDKELAKIIQNDLRKYGIDANIYEELLEVGENLKTSLEEMFHKADCTIVLITPNKTSLWIKHDLMLAKDIVNNSKGKKLLLVVATEGAYIPGLISDNEVLFFKENINEVIDKIASKVIDFFTVRNSKKENIDQNLKDKALEKKLKTNIETETGNNLKKIIETENNKDIIENENLDLKSNGKKKFWIIKMDPKGLNIKGIKEGKKIIFNTNFQKEKYKKNSFEEVYIGDNALGFATREYQGIFFELEVVPPDNQSIRPLKDFDIVVKKVINPAIPLNLFADKIPKFLKRLKIENFSPSELFFPIDERTYEEILSKSIQGNFLPYFLTEGNHTETSDQLDFENDYNSFASVIALKRVNPPLAIGLFGNWGSGKSFFMEKLQNKIEELSASKDDNYLEHIVPVKFNSWHYSDTNLWASLTTHIFESLNDYARKKEFGADAINAIYKDLNITAQQIEETEKKLAVNAVREKALRQQVLDKEELIDKKKEELDLWKGRDFVKLVFSDPFIKRDFENIKAQFQEENLINNISEIEKKLAEVDSYFDKIVKVYSLLKTSRKGKWWIIWILFGVFGIITLLFLTLNLEPFKVYLEQIRNYSLFISSTTLLWVTTLVVKLSPYFNKINQFYKRLKSLKETVEKEKEKVRLKEHEEIERLQGDIERLELEKNSIELEQTEIRKKKERIKKEIEEIGSGKLLGNFLEGKSADDAYIKQLGIISWIRKDFSTLNELFLKQRAVRQKETDIVNQVQIDRIVLYIDDLDRCNEDVVVKVLEAIHLLLAFPLFVVVVGVDPRWLNNALTEKYKTLFGGNKQVENNEFNYSSVSMEADSLFSKAATSYDYLEKIFQIPFALKPINKPGREKLIKYLLKDEMVNEVSKVPKDLSLTNVRKKAGGEILPKSKQEIEKQDILQADAIKEKEIIEKKIKERLVFTDEELAYMQKISPLFGHSPRTINRYVNIYRIIKAHGNLKVENSFSKDEFMPIMFILGIVIGHTTFAEEFIAKISNAHESKSFKDIITESNIDAGIKTIIESIAFDIESMTMKTFKRNIDLISRFSFRTLLK